VNGIAKPSAYIVKYDAYSLDQLKAVKVGNSPITSFTLSQDGAVLAYASADLSITVMDAMSLKVKRKKKELYFWLKPIISNIVNRP
jgi:prolactin regulatory element-binding protein